MAGKRFESISPITRENEVIFIYSYIETSKDNSVFKPFDNICLIMEYVCAMQALKRGL